MQAIPAPCKLSNGDFQSTGSLEIVGSYAQRPWLQHRFRQSPKGRPLGRTHNHHRTSVSPEIEKGLEDEGRGAEDAEPGEGRRLNLGQGEQPQLRG